MLLNENYSKKRRIYVYTYNCFLNNNISRIKIGETKREEEGEEGVIKRIKEQDVSTSTPDKPKLLKWWYSPHITDKQLHNSLKEKYKHLQNEREWFEPLTLTEVEQTFLEMESNINMSVIKLKTAELNEYNSKLDLEDLKICNKLINCRIQSIENLLINLLQYTTSKNEENIFNTIPSNEKSFSEKYDAELKQNNFKVEANKNKPYQYVSVTENNNNSFSCNNNYLIFHKQKRSSPAYTYEKNKLIQKRNKNEDILRRYQDIQDLEDFLNDIKEKNLNEKCIYMTTFIESLDCNEDNEKLLENYMTDNIEINFKINQLKKIENIKYNPIPTLIDDFKIAINLSNENRQYVPINLYASKCIVSYEKNRKEITSNLNLTDIEKRTLLPYDIEITFCFFKLN